MDIMVVQHREALLKTLRESPNGPTWPEGFVWSYSVPWSCAIGLLRRQGCRVGHESEWLGVSDRALDAPFFDAADKHPALIGKRRKNVRPEHVADLLEAAFAAELVT